MRSACLTNHQSTIRTESFHPETYCREDLMRHIGQAARQSLGRYDGILDFDPNPELLLDPLASQEAVMSARIEGTQASIGEVYQCRSSLSRGGARIAARDIERNHQLPKRHASRRWRCSMNCRGHFGWSDRLTLEVRCYPTCDSVWTKRAGEYRRIRHLDLVRPVA